MSLSADSKLGSFDIIPPLGAGPVMRAATRRRLPTRRDPEGRDRIIDPAQGHAVDSWVRALTWRGER